MAPHFKIRRDHRIRRDQYGKPVYEFGAPKEFTAQNYWLRMLDGVVKQWWPENGLPAHIDAHVVYAHLRMSDWAFPDGDVPPEHRRGIHHPLWPQFKQYQTGLLEWMAGKHHWREHFTPIPPLPSPEMAIAIAVIQDRNNQFPERLKKSLKEMKLKHIIQDIGSVGIDQFWKGAYLESLSWRESHSSVRRRSIHKLSEHDYINDINKWIRKGPFVPNPPVLSWESVTFFKTQPVSANSTTSTGPERPPIIKKEPGNHADTNSSREAGGAEAISQRDSDRAISGRRRNHGRGATNHKGFGANDNPSPAHDYPLTPFLKSVSDKPSIAKKALNEAASQKATEVDDSQSKEDELLSALEAKEAEVNRLKEELDKFRISANSEPKSKTATKRKKRPDDDSSPTQNKKRKKATDDGAPPTELKSLKKKKEKKKKKSDEDPPTTPTREKSPADNDVSPTKTTTKKKTAEDTSSAPEKKKSKSAKATKAPKAQKTTTTSAPDKTLPTEPLIGNPANKTLTPKTPRTPKKPAASVPPAGTPGTVPTPAKETDHVIKTMQYHLEILREDSVADTIRIFQYLNSLPATFWETKIDAELIQRCKAEGPKTRSELPIPCNWNLLLALIGDMFVKTGHLDRRGGKLKKGYVPELKEVYVWPR